MAVMAMPLHEDGASPTHAFQLLRREAFALRLHRSQAATLQLEESVIRMEERLATARGLPNPEYLPRWMRRPQSAPGMR